MQRGIKMMASTMPQAVNVIVMMDAIALAMPYPKINDAAQASISAPYSNTMFELARSSKASARPNHAIRA